MWQIFGRPLRLSPEMALALPAHVDRPNAAVIRRCDQSSESASETSIAKKNLWASLQDWQHAKASGDKFADTRGKTASSHCVMYGRVVRLLIFVRRSLKDSPTTQGYNQQGRSLRNDSLNLTLKPRRSGVRNQSPSKSPLFPAPAVGE